MKLWHLPLYFQFLEDIPFLFFTQLIITIIIKALEEKTKQVNCPLWEYRLAFSCF